MSERDRRTEEQGDWHDVPESVWPVWAEIFQESREATDLSAPCPVCGARELHRWYYRGRPADIVSHGQRYYGQGGGWQWCSRCRSYVHFSGLVPEWWSSDIELPLSVLEHSPEPIEQEMRRRRGEPYCQST